MVSCLRRFRTDGPPSSVGAWLRVVARNESIDLLRARHDLVPIDESLSSTFDVADLAVVGERCSRLLDDVRALPPGQRACFVLKEVNGLDYEEIGAIVGTSAGAARQRAHQARASLKAKAVTTARDG